jgi:hypothetical protein
LRVWPGCFFLVPQAPNAGITDRVEPSTMRGEFWGLLLTGCLPS